MHSYAGRFARVALAPVAVLVFALAARLVAAGPVLTLAEEDRKVLESYLGRGVVGRAVEAAPIDDTASLAGLKAGKWEWLFTSGQDKGKRIIREIGHDKPNSDGTSWRVALGENSALFINQDPDGDATVISDVDQHQGVVSRFSPPEPMVAAGIAPGESREIQIGVKVYDLRNPDHLEHTGSLLLTYTYLGAFEVTVPAGKFTAALMRSHFKGTIGPADVDDTVYRAFASGVGPVAAVEIKNISAMLFYQDHTKVGRVLTGGS